MNSILAVFGLALLLFVPVVHEGFALSAQERVPLSNPRLVNAFGDKVLEQVNVGQQILVSADLTNFQGVSQKFVYMVQIRDNDGIVIKFDSFSAELLSGQSFSPALSWTPEQSGVFTAKIFVWDNLNPAKPSEALSEPATITITAS